MRRLQQPSELIRRFIHGRKAAAVIGTEVTTWELLADAIALYFFEAFLAGVPAGEALLSAQRRLLAKHNPLGLAYSLYGSADLCLEKPKQAAALAWRREYLQVLQWVEGR